MLIYLYYKKLRKNPFLKKVYKRYLVVLAFPRRWLILSLANFMLQKHDNAVANQS